MDGSVRVEYIMTGPQGRICSGEGLTLRCLGPSESALTCLSSNARGTGCFGTAETSRLELK